MLYCLSNAIYTNIANYVFMFKRFYYNCCCENISSYMVNIYTHVRTLLYYGLYESIPPW